VKTLASMLPFTQVVHFSICSSGIMRASRGARTPEHPQRAHFPAEEALGDGLRRRGYRPPRARAGASASRLNLGRFL
jgi:hypothetical protein